MTRVIKNGRYVMDFRRPDTITGENNDIKEIHRGIGAYNRYISHNGCYTPLHSESSTGQRRKEKKIIYVVTWPPIYVMAVEEFLCAISVIFWRNSSDFLQFPLLLRFGQKYSVSLQFLLRLCMYRLRSIGRLGFFWRFEWRFWPRVGGRG